MTAPELPQAQVSAPPYSAVTGLPIIKVRSRVSIGRAKGSDIRLGDDVLVGNLHAEIIRRGERFVIIDRSGATGLGVYVEGQRVRRARLRPGTQFSIGRHDFYFDNESVYNHDDRGAPSLYVYDIDVRGRRTRALRWRRKRLLDDVSFMLREGNVLGIIGPSGSGKSTLLRTITGIVPATNGLTYFANRNLTAAYSELRTRIGVVPQDDVIHTQLTVRRALRYSAALRMAWDVPRKRRWARVEQVIKDLHLTSRATHRIETLSGGERKRVSVAVELLTQPSLLALDEPTTGLDPHLDRRIMILLARIARQPGNRRTVVVVTHSALHLDLCDHVLVLAKGGRIAYFGPPNQPLLDYFGAESYTDVFRMVASNGNDWYQRFLSSEAYKEYVGIPMAQWRQDHPEVDTDADAEDIDDEDYDELDYGSDDLDNLDDLDDPEAPPAPVSGTPSPAGPTPGSAPTRKRKPRVRPVGVQDASYLERVRQPIGAIGTFITLCRRTLAVIAADPLYAVLLVAAPPLLAALSRGVQGTMGLGQDQPHWNAEGHNLLTVLVVGAAFMGLANSIREIVKESAIYRRERASGLSPTVYLMSKFAVLALIACLQSAAFVALALIGRPRPAEGLVAQPLIEIMIDIAAVAIASSALGLAIGALARTADQTTVPLVVAVMFQLVFSSSLFRILPGSVLDWVSWIDPARWGFAATAATTNLNVAAFLTDGGCATVQPAPLCDPRWGHDLTTWWTAIGALVVQTALLLGLTRLFLNRFEPGRRATLR